MAETSFFDACNNSESAPKQSSHSVPPMRPVLHPYNGNDPIHHADEPGFDSATVAVGPLEIDPEEFIAFLDGSRLRLTPKEFGLLTLFARNPGRLLRREFIEREVWDGHASGRTIDIHISRLRHLLPAGAIQTVIRVGYRLVL